MNTGDAKNWKKELADMDPEKLLEILNAYISPLKREDNLLLSIHEILLERLTEQDANQGSCRRNASRYEQYREAIQDFPRIYLVIKTLEKEMDAETEKWEKGYLRTRLNTQYDILYQNHPKIQEAYSNELMDKHSYLKYLESFAELIIHDSSDSTIKNEVVIGEVFKDMMDMKLIRENLIKGN